MKRKRAVESQHQREIFNIHLKITEEPKMAKKLPRKLLKELMPIGLQIIQKVRKESVWRNHNNSVKTGLRLIEKV